LFGGADLNLNTPTPLNLNLINTGVIRGSNSNGGYLDFKNLMVRSGGKKVEGGEIKNSFNTNLSHLYQYNLKNSLFLDTNFSEYRLSKNFYNKNSKSVLKDLEAVDSKENF